jgi:hypothetical protein
MPQFDRRELVHVAATCRSFDLDGGGHGQSETAYKRLGHIGVLTFMATSIASLPDDEQLLGRQVVPAINGNYRWYERQAYVPLAYCPRRQVCITTSGRLTLAISSFVNVSGRGTTAAHINTPTPERQPYAHLNQVAIERSDVP